MTFLRRSLLPLSVVCLLGGATVSAQRTAPRQPLAGEGSAGFKLELTSFGATRAYAVGVQTITLVGTVRNEGTAALPAETVTLRMYAIAGLDYLEGATIVRLPTLEPDATATYRWKVQPTSPDAPLVAALVLERQDCMPQIRLLAIQHFADSPGAFGSPGPAKPLPAARATTDTGWIENGFVRLKVVPTLSEMAAAFVWRKTPGGWRQVGVALPMIEVLSGEPYQEPWWEALKVKRCSARADSKEASLQIAGQIGVRWRATADCTIHAGSSVMDIRVTLAPRRRMLLHGLRTTRFLIGEGSFGAAASEVLEPSAMGLGIHQAVRWGDITTGVIWPARPPFGDWLQTQQPTPDGADYRVAGAEYRPGAKPLEMSVGSSITIRWRVYALSPSKSVKDCFKIRLVP